MIEWLVIERPLPPREDIVDWGSPGNTKMFRIVYSLLSRLPMSASHIPFIFSIFSIMECTIEQLATQTALVPVAFIILFLYTSSTRATVFNQRYILAFTATCCQIIFTALAWIKGEIWLKLSLSSIFMTSVLREVR
jgi:predicted neutral ceramidase superfamily lipid hydrolase